VSIDLVNGRRHLLFDRLERPEIFCRYRNDVLRVQYNRPWKRRHIDISQLIAEAIARLGLSKMTPFYVNIGDRPIKKRRSRTRFASCAVDGFQDVAAPDAMFVTWPEARITDYDVTCRAIAAASAKPAPQPRAFWAGRADNSWRQKLMLVAQHHPDLIEARNLDASYDRHAHVYGHGFVPMADQVASHRYMVDVEGFGYSGRLKLLLHSGRVVLMQQRPWEEWFFPFLKPWQHYVPVARDFSDLAERVRWLGANPEREREIVADAQKFARTYLTRAAAVDAWADLLTAHAAAKGKLKPTEWRPRAN
jgi:hypothetical protein